MGTFYDRLKKRGVEILEDLDKWPTIPNASNVVQRLKDATEKAHERHSKIWHKLRKGFK